MTSYSCTPFQFKILRHIQKYPDGISPESLCSEFGNEALNSANDLYSDGYLNRAETPDDFSIPTDSQIAFFGFSSGNFMISNDGKLLLREFKEQRILTNKEKWIERLWGFLTGTIMAIIAWVFSGL